MTARAVIDVAGLILAMLVTAVLFVAMVSGVHGETRPCDLWADDLVTCLDSVR